MSVSIVVPQLGESVVEARIARWLKQPGDRVGVGEPVVELETEKIDLEVGADRSGVLARITRQEGEDVKVGDELGLIDEAAPGAGAPAEGVTPPAEAPPEPATERPAPATGRAAPATAAATATRPAPATSPPTEPPGPTPVAVAAAGAETARERATPTARRMAQTHAVSLSEVPATGEAGRVTKKDVASVLGRGRAPAAPVAPQGPRTDRTEERIRMSKRRLTIARNLVEAQRAAAMLTTFNEIDMSAVMALRERRKQEFRARYGVGLGIASFFVKASVAALKAFPRLNAEIQGDEMVLKRYCDVGIAVGAAQGLVVPVLRDADRMTFAEIETGIRAFAQKAEEGTLSLDDLRGGTFTITNGGVFGSLLSTPILNPPQVGILGLHKIEDRPVALNREIVLRPMMYVALTYDHRIVDGLEAVQFLVRVKEFIEDPGHLLLES